MKAIIEPGDIIAIKGNGIVSGLIAHFSRGPISHVGLVTCSGPDYDSILVTQSLDTIKTITLAETMASSKYGYCLHSNIIDGDSRLKISNYALAQLGHVYPYSNIFWQLIKAITGNAKYTEYLDKPRSVMEICSELVAYSYLEAGLDFTISPQDITPSDIFHYALINNWLVQ